MNERRQVPRWKIKKEAKVWLPHGRGSAQCIVEDMHIKGMRVSFDKKLPPQQTIRMSFSIGDSFDYIKVKAQTSWVKEENGRYIYGLSFSAMEAIELLKMSI